MSHKVPVSPRGMYTVTSDSPGVTLRQWYAGMALPSLIDKYTLAQLSGQQTTFSEFRNKTLQRLAFDIADAMIAEGEKP